MVYGIGISSVAYEGIAALGLGIEYKNLGMLGSFTGSGIKISLLKK